MTTRRITIFDVMTLVAATAFGLWLARFSFVDRPAAPAGWTFTWPLTPSAGGYASKRWLIPIAEKLVPVLPCLSTWSGAILVIRLIPPRPRRRRLVGQPGFVAAVVVVVVVLVESALLVGSAKLDGRFGWSSPSDAARFAANGFVMLAHHAGWAVAASWLTLALVGRWRSEAGWIDRLGRVLGVVWIMIGPPASLLLDHAAWWGNFLTP
ncbi:hypothetical protein [Paludisphaera rhizosphaerae]|uniref:hypothetical protein n=1 Tax=Paludisphaera rhizosphaerae TaxID=2711216 RepID=UPI0013ED45FA|nr:hypothetical protein [Paludisphaera rhizosphaerae]